MRVEVYIVLSSLLIGLGLGSALSRRNIVSIVMAIVTAGAGALLAMATLGRQSEAVGDGSLFALVMGSVLMVFMVLGCALAYRRYLSAGTTDIGQENKLRH